SGGIHGQATMVWNGRAHLVGGSNPQGFNPRDYHDVFTVPDVVSLLAQESPATFRVIGSAGRWRIEGMAPGRYRIAILDPMGRLLDDGIFPVEGSGLILGRYPVGYLIPRIARP
ncbi:MAG TPA: hypothetical protein VK465_13180, partial [Fibrobacteria bacterium]|nr:hypothetical protein [Fibrobacteria bacterium]